MSKTKLKSDSDLSAVWACDVRTIRRWRSAKAPLADETRMRAWLAGRKNLPPGTRALLDATRKTERATDAQKPVSLATGAGAALRRLEGAEAAAFGQFERALASGDAVEIKVTRASWLALCESLRRLDATLEMDRRASGETLPRVAVEKLLEDFALRWRYLRQPLRNSCPQIASMSDPKAVWLLLEAITKNFTADILASLRTAPRPFPSWVFEALLRGGSTDVPDDHALIDRKMQLFRDITELTGTMTAAEVAKYFAEERAKLERYRA